MRPGGGASLLPLTRQPSGEYRGSFTSTGQLGAYQFTAHVSATTPLGNFVTRYRSLTGIIFRPGGGGDGGDGGDGSGPGGQGSGGHGHGGGTTGSECRRAFALLDRLESLLQQGQELAGPDLDQVRALVKRLRAFVDGCCGCSSGRSTKAEIAALEDAIRRSSDLLTHLRGSSPDTV